MNESGLPDNFARKPTTDRGRCKTIQGMAVSTDDDDPYMDDDDGDRNITCRNVDRISGDDEPAGDNNCCNCGAPKVDKRFYYNGGGASQNNGGGGHTKRNNNTCDNNIETNRLNCNSNSSNSMATKLCCRNRRNRIAGGYLIAVHRKLSRQETYFLSYHKSRPSLFGVPLLIPCYERGTNKDLYCAVWIQVARLLSPLPPTPPDQANHATDW